MTHCPHYRLIAQQSRDIEDLLNLIKELEERVINLEKEISNKVMPIVQDDSYYWEHG